MTSTFLLLVQKVAVFWHVTSTVRHESDGFIHRGDEGYRLLCTVVLMYQPCTMQGLKYCKVKRCINPEIKSRRLRWSGHVPRVGKERCK